MQILDSVKQAAAWAGEQLGVPAYIILGQWAFEQPDGLANPARYNYNIAGITTSGIPGDWRAYRDEMDFANDYVTLIKSGYPNVPGSQTAQDFAYNLKYGSWGSYYGEDTSPEGYAGGIISRIEQMGDVGLDTVSTLPYDNTHISQGSGTSWWNKFLDFIGAPKKMDSPEAVIAAREAVAKIGYTPQSFIDKTNELKQQTAEYRAANESSFSLGNIKNLLTQGLMVIAGIGLFIIGLILLSKQTSEGGIIASEQ